MIYFLLPNVNVIIDMKCIFLDENESYVSNSLCNYLNVMKKKIDHFEGDWDIFKKYTNPFEYINTIIPKKNVCISKIKPLSRSFYKMIELIDMFDLLENVSVNMKSFHIAEGPGGFIEALTMKRNNVNDSYVGMSLVDDKDDKNIPGWNKSRQFLEKNRNVFIENGKNEDGDILNIDNFDYVIDKYSNIDMITGDGGFDFSIDFNNQEEVMFRLLYAQVCYALCMQKQGGCFILKIFDCFMKRTIDLLYLLSSFYKKTYITKPQTSRYANSEKYIVCKGFYKSVNKGVLRNVFIQILESENINSIIDTRIPEYFINKVEEMNAIFGQQQIDTINNTMKLIENKQKSDKTENLVKNNIQKCIHWCTKHNIPYNNITYNSFIND